MFYQKLTEKFEAKFKCFSGNQANSINTRERRIDCEFLGYRGDIYWLLFTGYQRLLTAADRKAETIWEFMRT